MFTFADAIGSLGVTLLLIAFLLNLGKKLQQDDIRYILMNFVGAGLATIASVLIRYMPFVVLEGTWTLVSLFALIRFKRKASN